MDTLESRLKSLSRSTSPLALVASSILASTSNTNTMSVEAQYKAVSIAFARADVELPEYVEDPEQLVKGLLETLMTTLPSLESSSLLLDEMISTDHPTDDEVQQIERRVTKFRQSLKSPTTVFEKYSRVFFFHSMSSFERVLYASALLDFCAVHKLTPNPIWETMASGA